MNLYMAMIFLIIEFIISWVGVINKKSGSSKRLWVEPVVKRESSYSMDRSQLPEGQNAFRQLCLQRFLSDPGPKTSLFHIR